MTVYQKADGKTLVDSSGRLLTPECPPSEACCGSPEFPPWPPGDKPPWFDDGTPPAPTTGECPTGCLQCGCTPPCTPRTDGYHIACCQPESPTEIIVRFSGTATGRIDYEPGGSGDLLNQEIEVQQDSTWSSISGLTSTRREREWSNGVLIRDVTFEADAPPADCPVPPTGVFVGFNVTPPPGSPCYGLKTIAETISGGTRTSTMYSDCRRSYFQQSASSSIPGDRSGTATTQTFMQVTYTPDPCTTPRLCDPATNGGFIP